MPELRNRSLSSAASTVEAPSIAIIGCGAITESYYLPALSRHPAVIKEIILVDRDVARADELASRFHIRACVADYRELLGSVDGAIVAVPTHLHHPIAMEFLARGIHVLCEKPLAESAPRAVEMVEQAKAAGATLCVNYLQRLVPSFARVKELLSKKTYGEPLSIQYYVGEEFTWPTVSGFYFNSSMDGRGILRDRGAHVMDHICWWLEGKPDLISSENDSFGGSDATAHVRFALGHCIGEARLSWLCAYPSWFMIRCERGTIRGDVYDYSSLELQSGSGQAKRIALKSTEKTKVDIADRVVSNFIAGITRDEKPLVAGRDVLDSVRFVDECYSAVSRSKMPWYETAEVLRGLR